MRQWTIWFKMTDYSTVTHKEAAFTSREAVARALRNPPKGLLGHAEIKSIEIEADDD